MADETELARIRWASGAAARAASDMEAFARRLALPVGPATVAEYATLLARDEEARADRAAVFDDLGLRVPSLAEPEPGEAARPYPHEAARPYPHEAARPYPHEAARPYPREAARPYPRPEGESA